MTDRKPAVGKLQELSTIFAGALGFTILFLMATSAFVNSLIPYGTAGHHGVETAAKPEAGKTETAETKPTESEGAPTTPAETAAESSAPIGTLLAAANAGNGEKVAKKCLACHGFDKGGKQKVGPNLYETVGRPIASAEGFAYSPAMMTYAAENKTWTYEHLATFLRKPGATVPKTKMGFAGVPKDSDLADLIAYLRSLSDNPAPLPN